MTDDEAVYVANEFQNWTAEGAMQRMKRNRK